MMAFCPEHSKWDQNPKITPPKRDDEHPHPFHMRSPPPGPITQKVFWSAPLSCSPLCFSSIEFLLFYNVYLRLPGCKKYLKVRSHLTTRKSDIHCRISIKETLLIRDLKPALNENVAREDVFSTGIIYYNFLLTSDLGLSSSFVVISYCFYLFIRV